MATQTAPIRELTEAEIQRSREITAEHDRARPRATHVHYNETEKKLVISLKNKTELRIPILQLQGLQNATPQQIANAQLTASGNAVHWEALDVQMSIEGLTAGIFGTEEWMRHLNSQL